MTGTGADISPHHGSGVPDDSKPATAAPSLVAPDDRPVQASAPLCLTPVPAAPDRVATEAPSAELPTSSSTASSAVTPHPAPTPSRTRTAPGSTGSNSVTPICKPVRRRDKDHLAFVAAQQCLICQRAPCDAHHIRFAQPRALGRKVSDEFTVPLCRHHHEALHHQGNEAAWWANVGIAPLPIAENLWAATKLRSPSRTTAPVSGLNPSPSSSTAPDRSLNGSATAAAPD